MSNGGGEGVEVVEERVAGLNVDGNGGRETGAWRAWPPFLERRDPDPVGSKGRGQSPTAIVCV